MDKSTIGSVMVFYNRTTQDFDFSWDSVSFTVKAGEKMVFPEYLARHAARKLAEQELAKTNITLLLNEKNIDKKAEEYLNADVEVKGAVAENPETEVERLRRRIAELQKETIIHEPEEETKEEEFPEIEPEKETIKKNKKK